MSGTQIGELGYAEALACVTAVYRALDAGDGAVLAGCFTPDAIWHRADGDLDSLAKIEALAQARDPARTTAHIVGNLALERSDDGWTARYYLTVYVGQNGQGAFGAILDCEDRLVMTEAGPRIAAKRNKPRLRAQP